MSSVCKNSSSQRWTGRKVSCSSSTGPGPRELSLSHQIYVHRKRPQPTLGRNFVLLHCLEELADDKQLKSNTNRHDPQLPSSWRDRSGHAGRIVRATTALCRRACSSERVLGYATLRCATLCCARRACIHSFIRHKATAPQATHVRVTVYVSCRAACAVVRVCTVRSLRVCACGVWAHFFAQGELTRPSTSSGAHRPRPSQRELPPRSLAHTPHAPALVPPVVDHLPCRGGVSLGSRSACAAQQGRPTPSSPEERTNCEGKEKLRSGDATASRVRNSAFRTSRHPPQYQRARAPCADHMALNKIRRPRDAHTSRRSIANQVS